MGSDSCRGWYGCIFPRDAGKNCYMLTQYNSIYYGYLLLFLLVKYVTYNCGNIGICNRTTELVYRLLHIQLKEKQNFVLVYDSYHHYLML